MRLAALIAVAVLGLAAALAVRAPLSLALALSGARDAALDWRAAEGSVWNGVVHGLALSDYELGQARVALSPWSLLTLSPRAALSVSGPEGEGAARVTAPLGGGLRVSGGRMTLRLSELSAIDPRLRARGGTFEARDVDIVLAADGTCRRAAGVLRTDALTYGFEDRWRGPALSGDVTCEDGALVMRLAGAEEGQAVDATARLDGGVYSVEVVLDTQDQDVARLAPVIGFAPWRGAWRYQWRSAP